MSVCMSVCPHAYLRNHVSTLHRIKCPMLACYLSCGRGLVLLLQYAIYFRFWNRRCKRVYTQSDSPAAAPNRGGVLFYDCLCFFCFVERYELLSEFLQSKVNEFKIYFCQVAIGRIYALHAMRPLASRQKPTVHASGNFIRLSRSLHAMHSWFEPQQSTCAMCRPTLCGPI